MDNDKLLPCQAHAHKRTAPAMDPTLAPGYVPPNNTKAKTATKGHHWAGMRKTNKARATGTHNYCSEKDGATSNGDNSAATSPSSTPSVQRLSSAPDYLQIDGSAHTVNGRHHPRVPRWRAARSALSDGEGIGGPADLEEVPIGLKRQALQLEDYAFPDDRLRKVMDGAPRVPDRKLTLQTTPKSR